ncbi:MAG TPA: hypothetical protein VMB28_12730 [Mycobacterium sp.]|nr:hypothetical protein [Mycobacterium sp.]HTH86158.1 hypothetical protein [Mycobacterium sp.]
MRFRHVDILEGFEEIFSPQRDFLVLIVERSYAAGDELCGNLLDVWTIL